MDVLIHQKRLNGIICEFCNDFVCYKKKIGDENNDIQKCLIVKSKGDRLGIFFSGLRFKHSSFSLFVSRLI